MILASAFPEAPPSMFGHIFMQLSSAKTADLKQIGLFDQGLNFAAVIPKDAGIEMAYKGMFGGYEGHFTVAPFYQMLAEYSHTEERDLWIYKLNLSQAETTDLLLHVWEIEMNQSYLAYFFLDENCAYQLLSILQVVRPNTELTSGFGAYALPVTAIQFLEANGFLSATRTVRRAPAKVARAMIDELSDADRETLNEVLTGKSAHTHLTKPLLAIALKQLTSEKQSVRGRWEPQKDLLLSQLLQRQSKDPLPLEHGPNSLETSSQTQTLSSAEQTSSDQPLLAHWPAQWWISSGIMRAEISEDFSTTSNVESDHFGKNLALFDLGFKPALHDPLARGPGFGEGMFLDVFSTTVRLKRLPDQQTQMKLHKFELIDIGVFQPITQERISSSWRIKSSFESDHLEGPLMFRSIGRTGLTSKLAKTRTVGYSLVGLDLGLKPDFLTSWFGPAFTFGISGADAWDTHRLSPWSWSLSGDFVAAFARSWKHPVVRTSVHAELAWIPSYESNSEFRLALRHIKFEKIQTEVLGTLGRHF